VIACIALFVALSGTGYAVTALPRDSVGSAQLRKRAVKEADLGNRAVITSKLADQAVTRAKLAPGAVTADRVAPDALTGAQIDESTLGRVPSAADAAHALTAGRAELADKVEEAQRALVADKAAHADDADRATEADRADRAKIADALAHVDRNQQDVEIADGGFQNVAVECDQGLTPVGGGFMIGPGTDVPLIVGSAPEPGGWDVAIIDFNPGNGTPVRGTAYAICVAADGP
jgi:hypothetical protein